MFQILILVSAENHCRLFAWVRGELSKQRIMMDWGPDRSSFGSRSGFLSLMQKKFNTNILSVQQKCDCVISDHLVKSLVQIGKNVLIGVKITKVLAF